jgi:hypothetical protein
LNFSFKSGFGSLDVLGSFGRSGSGLVNLILDLLGFSEALLLVLPLLILLLSGGGKEIILEYDVSQPQN